MTIIAMNPEARIARSTVSILRRFLPSTNVLSRASNNNRDASAAVFASRGTFEFSCTRRARRATRRDDLSGGRPRFATPHSKSATQPPECP